MGHHTEAYVGIDTSKSRNAIAIADGGRGGEVRYLGEFPATEAAIRKLVAKLAAKYRDLTFCYEAGPTGYGLYRLLKSLSHECLVVAPSLVPKKAGDRVKTNRRDAVTPSRSGPTSTAALPDRNSTMWSPAKNSDVTGGGLYLFVTPDECRPGNAASKLWRMGYRFHSRQKTYSIGPYGNGKDGTFSLADARRERDKAKDLLKDGKDASTEKQLVKHRQAAARPFEQWADEWLAKKKVEKVKRGRIVAVRDPKTIEVLVLRVGYVKARFGKLCRQDIKRPDVLAFMRSYEAEGKLETRDRVRSIGEQICDYADVEGDGYNPFRNLNGQMIANISTPRPGVTEPRDVTRVFKLISAPWTRARFSDVVGLALRFDALTIPRPGMVNEMEWSEVDLDAKRWTIPAAKMKTGWDHVVPLSRQALAILRSVQKLTGHRRYAFSCSKDAPLSNNTLNKRLRLLGIDTKTDHCAHGFRTTFSTLSHHEEIKDAKAWDGDVVELQLAHLDNSTVEGLYKKHGPLALIGSRTKLMQHWADRIDHWLDPKKVMPIKRGTQA